MPCFWVLVLAESHGRFDIFHPLVYPIQNAGATGGPNGFRTLPLFGRGIRCFFKPFVVWARHPLFFQAIRCLGAASVVFARRWLFGRRRPLFFQAVCCLGRDNRRANRQKNGQPVRARTIPRHGLPARHGRGDGLPGRIVTHPSYQQVTHR